MAGKLTIRRKWVVERLDKMIYGGEKLDGMETDAATAAYEFLEEEEAAGNAIINTVVALCQDHVNEVEAKERRARKAYGILRKEIRTVLQKAQDAFAGKKKR